MHHHFAEQIARQFNGVGGQFNAAQTRPDARPARHPWRRSATSFADARHRARSVRALPQHAGRRFLAGDGERLGTQRQFVAADGVVALLIAADPIRKQTADDVMGDDMIRAVRGGRAGVTMRVSKVSRARCMRCACMQAGSTFQAHFSPALVFKARESVDMLNGDSVTTTNVTINYRIIPPGKRLLEKTEDPRRACMVWPAQTDGSAGVRDHQDGDAVQAISAA